jgi:hypothetical protein
LDTARELLRTVDPRDAPYVALALAIGANGVWSEAKDLASVPGFHVFRTTDLLKGWEPSSAGKREAIAVALRAWIQKPPEAARFHYWAPPALAGRETYLRGLFTVYAHGRGAAAR